MERVAWSKGGLGTVVVGSWNVPKQRGTNWPGIWVAHVAIDPGRLYLCLNNYKSFTLWPIHILIHDLNPKMGSLFEA